jgi:hypothetical protein
MLSDAIVDIDDGPPGFVAAGKVSDLRPIDRHGRAAAAKAVWRRSISRKSVIGWPLISPT